MKKNLLILIIGLVSGTLITVGASHVFDASDVSYNPSDTSWEVNNANDAIDGLKSDLNNIQIDVTNYKSDITDALSNKGVEVTEESSMEDIISNIENMDIKKNIIRKNLYSGAASSRNIDCTNIPNYQDLTNDNFICGISSSSGSENSSLVKRFNESISCSYNNTNGILSISYSTGGQAMSFGADMFAICMYLE